jgi:putative transposase
MQLMRKTFKYRLYPTRAQETILDAQLDECRWLYNHFLEVRKTSYEATQTAPGLYDQQKTIPALKVQRPSLGDVHSQVLQNVAVRIDLAFKAFFRRTKAGDVPGYPRFRGKFRYDSMTFPQCPSGCSVDGDQLVLSKVGTIRVVLHRPLEGTPKTCTLRRSSTGKWYVSFSCEVPEPTPLPANALKVGIDVGLTTFATLSPGPNGEPINNPRFFRTDEKELAKVQRKFAKTQKGTPERRKRRKPVARVHERIAFRRDNFAHQTARRIVNRFGFIAVEDLEVNRMVHNHCLAKSISDASWSLFFTLLFFKAESAGRRIVKVNPAYTSQQCHRCGYRQKMPLSERIYWCECCKGEWGRDHNASLNVLALGLQGLGGNSVEAAAL